MSRKRLFSSINIWDEMIRASSVRNYMLDDPLIDYLQEYNIKSINSVPRKSRYINQTHDNFTNFLIRLIVTCCNVNAMSSFETRFKIADDPSGNL